MITEYKNYIVQWTVPDVTNDNGFKLIKARISGTNREHALSKLMSHSIYQVYLQAAYPKELDDFTFNHQFLMWIDISDYPP